GGRVWLFARARQNDFRTPLGSLWLDWACYADGDHWTGPLLVPHSDNLLYNSPVVLPAADGGLAVVHSSDNRQHRTVTKRAGAPAGGNGSLGGENDPYDNDLYLSHLHATGAAQPAKLVAAKTQPDPKAVPSPATLKE